MRYEEQDKFNHERIMEFLQATDAEHEDDVTASVKATICQFLINTRHGLQLCAKKNGAKWVTREQIIGVQIEELRRCIVDLSKVLNSKEGMQ